MHSDAGSLDLDDIKFDAVVLCVEDEMDIRESIADELHEEGYLVLQAEDGQIGLDLAVDHKPDLIISDITMPNMNGHDFLKTLRADYPKLADIPFLFLTALADRDHVLKGMDLGADDYLTKPLDLEMLLTKARAKIRMSNRMKNKSQDEKVKLYKALKRVNESHRDAEETWPDMEPRKIVLIGRGSSDLWGVQSFLSKLGHETHVFTSGRSYLSWLEGGKVNADIALIWFHTDDMQAPMVRKMASAGDCSRVMVIPEGLAESTFRDDCSGFDGTLTMPLQKQQLVQLVESLS